MDSYTEPELARSALVTIDLQRCTLDSQSFEIRGTTDVIPAVAAVAEAFRASQRPIIHVIRLYRPDGSNADLCRRQQLLDGAELVLVGTEGRKLAQQILPELDIDIDDEHLLSGQLQEIGPREWIMHKPRWGAFYGTKLEQVLRSLDISTIVLAGCNYPNCPRASLYEASERDFRLVAIADGISRLDERGRQELENIGVMLMDSVTCIPKLRSLTKHSWAPSASRDSDR
ncbi:MAG: cysteine hydrolase [Gammaproteobacteria bacterium]|nr:cysteine hydrolase [Gammaproteobacteria bacterium]